MKRVVLLCIFVLCAIPAFAGPWLGVTFKKTTYENHLALDVKGVHPGSGCFTAGVVSGDKIIGINGKPLAEMSQITSVISKSKTGSTVNIEVFRGRKRCFARRCPRWSGSPLPSR